MANEFTRDDPEEPVHACSESAWVCRTGGWYCCHCERWQCSITGRVSIRDPEPFHGLKPVSRAFIKKHGSRDWQEVPLSEPPTVDYDFSEVEQALINAYGPLDMSRYDQWGDEVSG